MNLASNLGRKWYDFLSFINDVQLKEKALHSDENKDCAFQYN